MLLPDAPLIPDANLPPSVLDAETNGARPADVLTTDFPGAEPPTKKKKKKSKKTREGDGRQVGTTRGIETMFRTSYMTHVNLSALADSKANIMISINGIIMSIIIASISPKIDTNPWLLVPTSVLLITCLVSIVYAVLAARPRVQPSEAFAAVPRARKASILFFGQFTAMKEEDFVGGMVDLLQNLDSLYESMIRDIYSLGQVLSQKFRLLRVSYTVFMIGLAAGVLLYIAVFVVVAVSAPMQPPGFQVAP